MLLNSETCKIIINVINVGTINVGTTKGLMLMKNLKSTAKIAKNRF